MFTSLPQMQGALANWQQQLTFTTIVKTTVNYKVVETKTDVVFKGVWQPMGPEKIMLKPSGQRSWKWFTCHAQPFVNLKTDEEITFNGLTFRVMEKVDYKEYGYIEYHLVEGYKGA